MSKSGDLNHAARAALVLLSYPVSRNAGARLEKQSRCLSGTIWEQLAALHLAWLARPFISR
ncbi:hypothetical protein D3C86_1316830 [compost metagenome]